MKRLFIITTLLLLTSCAHTTRDGSNTSTKTDGQSYEHWARYHSNADRR